MQGGIERAVLHLQEFIRGPLNVLADLVTVSGSVEKCPQNKHVKRSLEEPDPLLRLLRHGRHSTLNLVPMVDTRLSIVNGAASRMTTSANALIDTRIEVNFRVPGGLSAIRKVTAMTER